MKKRLLCMLCALSLLFVTGCGKHESTESEPDLTVLATTYPVYLFAKSLTQGVDGVEVQRLNTGNISCLHDYTLSVGDMKMIESADLIAMNGVGLETFMEDALAASEAQVADLSEGVELLENLAHHHEEGDEHDHGHYDPHIWLDPAIAADMIKNLGKALSAADPAHSPAYAANAVEAVQKLEDGTAAMKEELSRSALENIGLITFHDGFQYFARAFGLELLAAIEEEAGSEASAKEITEISGLVEERDIPVIFTETNGSDATAQAISRETGCAVSQLNMLMSGEGDSIDAYLEGLSGNITAIVAGFGADQG